MPGVLTPATVEAAVAAAVARARERAGGEFDVCAVADKARALVENATDVEALNRGAEVIVGAFDAYRSEFLKALSEEFAPYTTNRASRRIVDHAISQARATLDRAGRDFRRTVMAAVDVQKRFLAGMGSEFSAAATSIMED